MNDLGLIFVWTAVQVSLFLIPAVALYTFASRRSPASGAWVAALGLGLVVMPSLFAVVPREGTSASKAVPFTASNPVATSVPRKADLSHNHSDEGGIGISIVKFRHLWQRFETTAAAPADHCRQWGRVLAVVALTGAGGGLLHLIVGLWAVHACRRRSKQVNDPGLSDLIDELRGALGCRRRVEVRETDELTAPATAGWCRPVVLLPDDWRSWDEHERRAVFAHELAHVCRNDYATWVVARAALALHFYHPLVHWLAARLQLEQELAADALGATFSGGRAVYLHSLSRLMLRQDGRSPRWPVRAFLPAKGTLIRRIAMLRDETNVLDRPWSGLRRMLTASLLLTVAVVTLLLHGPARGEDGEERAPEVKGARSLGKADAKDQLEPFDLSYYDNLGLTEKRTRGFVAIRPSAIFRRSGMGAYRTAVNLLIAREWAKAAKANGFDPTQPGHGPLRVEMFEQFISTGSIWRTGGKKPDGRLELGSPMVIRTTEPVDWVKLCRLFKLDLTEKRDRDRVYYQINDPRLGLDGCFTCPDDRTFVLAEEKLLLGLLRRQNPPMPVFAKRKDWDRFLRGLAVVAVDNRNGQLANTLKNDEPIDIDITTLFNHTDLLIFGLDNDDQITFRAMATCSDAVAGESTVRATKNLLEAAYKSCEFPVPTTSPHRDAQKRALEMAKNFLKNATVESEGSSVLMRSTGLGTIADFASLVAAGVIGL